MSFGEIQVQLKTLEYGEKVHFFYKLISKSETFIYFRFLTCKVKHFKSCFCFNFDDLSLNTIHTVSIVSLSCSLKTQ